MSQRPNVLFIVSDDHRMDAIRSFGDDVVETPVLDQLVASGASFRQTHISGGFVGAVCVPSRACIMTGTDAFRATISQAVDDTAGSMTINPSLATLPATLRGAGYQTYSIGKWHNDTKSFAEGFEAGARLFFGGMSDHERVPLHDYDPSGEYSPEDRSISEGFSTELFADAAVDFLENYREADAFFLYIAFTAPHDPRTPPREYADLYDPASIPLPPNFTPTHPFDNGELVVRDELLAANPRDPDEVKNHIADYYGMISHLDAQIGRVLRALEHSGRADDTIVVYTADHGLAVGQHGLLGKQNLYEHSIRVPLIMRGPRLPVGKQVTGLGSNADIFPTLCELVDIPVPHSVDGRSLLPALDDEQSGVRDRVYAAYKDVQRMASDGQWKLIRYYRSAERQVGTDTFQLFDLVNDPLETRDLSAEPSSRRQGDRLFAELDAWQRLVGDPLAGRRVPPPATRI